jgi:rhodanese-related sulfurtransferase
VIVERNVLEWRLDPRSSARLDFADRYDLPVVVLCQEGYTSSLAAAALHDLGLHRATDLAGGFAGWRAAGLPTTPTTTPTTDDPTVDDTGVGR